ncbi:MAG TPA: slipin family protein [Thermoanaerobaculia bacterium]|nr:slipin family protein [Thermoanaerobaculia bacterium]
MLRWFKVRDYERGLLYRDRVFRRVLGPGRHWVFDPLLRVRVERVSVRDPFLASSDLDVIVKSGALGSEARVLDLADFERALVWVDGRFVAILGRGLWVAWTVFRQVRAEVIDARSVRFEHPQLAAVLAHPPASRFLEAVQVEAGQVALVMVDGRLAATLEPGRYAFWKDVVRLQVVVVDMRERVIDVGGQEIMTADKVTLRLNAVVTFRVADPARAVAAVESYEQSLYREAQLALRAVIGARELDALLTEKESVAEELEALVRASGGAIGLQVTGLGIKDVILPGEMKALLNRVTEAKKAAEADLITRREETAAMRSQANTARIFESSPALMRLRELEVLEKVAGKAQLTVILGETGLAEKVTKLV